MTLFFCKGKYLLKDFPNIIILRIKKNFFFGYYKKRLSIISKIFKFLTNPEINVIDWCNVCILYLVDWVRWLDYSIRDSVVMSTSKLIRNKILVLGRRGTGKLSVIKRKYKKIK